MTEGFDAFIDELTREGDVVIENWGPKGALSLPQSLALRDKFDRERRGKGEDG